MNWYLDALKKYAVFSGRARRKEYWMYILFNFLTLVVAAILDNVLGFTMAPLPYGAIYLIVALGTFLPSLSVLVRRLHDVGKGGGWVFIALIPIVGSIWLLVLLCTEGQAGENKFGPDPKNQPSFNNDALDSHLTN